MRYRLTSRKKIAVGLLVLWLLNIVVPAACYALTSGPAQPEARSFQPAGVSDMVDLFTGGFKYNIPLLDIDGYPVNLNYESGTGIDDEASWVGLGWNVNVGAINRQVRGIPDDMAGDMVEVDHYTKPKVTVGGRLTAKVETKGIGLNLGKGDSLKASGSLSLGIFNDNYTGIGAEIGANAGLSFTFANENSFTAGLGLGVTSNTASGVEVTPYMNLSVSEGVNKKTTETAGLSASLGYNTRSGLKGLTLGSSFDVKADRYQDLYDVYDYKYASIYQGSQATGIGASGSVISYNTEPINPNIQIPYSSRYGSFSVDAGGVVEIVFLGGGLTGYKSVREVASQQLLNPAYGFLYAERGKNQKNAVMDFTREKENPVIPELPNLALPIHTPDLFTFTSQTGSGQFRLYRGGSGAFFDNNVTDDDKVTSGGADFGAGFIAHGGVTLFNQTTINTTSKWVADNNYLGKADFQDASYRDPSKQHVYFKMVGEKTLEDSAMVSALHDVQPLEVSINGKTANAAFTNNSLTNLVKNHRQINQTSISYLTAGEGMHGALDKMLKYYAFNTYSSTSKFTLPTNNKPLPQDSVQRVSSYRQKHHLSELTVTDGSGKRMVYGMPVYNIAQSEYSFAVGSSYTKQWKTNNQVQLSLNNPGTPSVSINHNKGIDYYYHRQTQPAYASSFLLTAILSPDYVDKTGNGITDDDLGTAIKFNYSKLSSSFKWRSPYNGGTLNRGLLADKDDDKASIIYGEKEVCYLQSIESKTKVAYFITQDRRDAVGVTDFTGTKADTNNKQKCLMEIRLYSKADMSKPIKVVKFEYTYELCRHLPNNLDNHHVLDTIQYSSNPSLGGKLTLKKVYFEYQNSPKGANFPYQFSYINTIRNTSTGIDTAVNYNDLSTDRWGTYKSVTESSPLRNDEFPYTKQDLQGNDTTVKSRVDQNASLWHLNSIQLPTGGTINVTYESNDYAYVQDKRASVMSGIDSLINGSGTPISPSSPSILRDAKGLMIKIPNAPPSGTDPTAWFIQNYLDGSPYIYSKFSVKLATPYSPSGGDAYNYDFISSYSQVQSVTVAHGFAKIFLQDRSDGGVTANPIIFSAWQTIKNEYPRYAYPGFDQRTGDSETSSAVTTAVKAVISAVSNLSELKENFYQKAAEKKFASLIQLNKSFARIAKADGRKLGGGVRVKKIRINDNWQSLSGSKTKIASYGQSYDYTMVDNGVTISSGVATYEPSVGCDENPMRQPVPYVQKVNGALDNFYELEQPFGESFFPAPSVGYSKVTITDLNKKGVPDPSLRTGYAVNEFYTAKDFPVQVTVMPLSQNENKPVNKLSFVGGTSIDELTMSQGYDITLNDMHGKQKATRTFNQSGAEIASTVYYYKTNPKGADEFTLNNAVDIVNPNGTLSHNKVVGRDIDFFTDFREFETKNSGISDNIGFDVVSLIFVTFPLPHFPTPENNEYKLFRSACAVKVNQYYGIIDRIVKTENGSSITTKNLAFDGLTGEPVVTQTQNEFNKSIYSVNMPAYWAYTGMGGAYQNSGLLLGNFTTNANGEFVSQYNSYLKSGDEIIDVATGNRYWVIEDKKDSTASVSKKLINRFGELQAGFRSTLPDTLVKVVRSGYRNMLSSNTLSIVSLNNPIQNNKLRFTANSDLTGMKVINASATIFNDRWATDQHGVPPDSTAVHFDTSKYVQTPADPTRGTRGGNITPLGPPPIVIPEYTNALNRSGIILNPVFNSSRDTINIHGSFHLNTAANFVGTSGDGIYSVVIDNTIVVSRGGRDFWVVSTIAVPAGDHQIAITVVKDPSNMSPWAVGLELYNAFNANSFVDFSGVSTLFSTIDLANKHDSVATVYRKHINPYTRGFAGNWRERGSAVFQQSRHYNQNPTVAGIDAKDAGYINNFSGYWYYGTLPSGKPGWVTDQLGNRARWVTANTVTGYDEFGQQLENRDALGRFSAAKFDFNGELPSAVASNAQNREVYAASFEDRLFSPGTVSRYADDIDFVQTGTGANIKNFVVDSLSHSGNYSVKLPTGGLTLTTPVHDKYLGIDKLLSVDSLGEYNLKPDTGLYPIGFSPMNAKPYIFDVWVHDGHDTDKTVRLNLTMNGVGVPLTCKALVEGWKLLEGTVNVPGFINTVSLALSSSSPDIFIDDLRIHPFNSQMKTYVYDDQTLRLMAEIDENGFATFYEYDDEGLLIRVKKETERGIMTIKESRSSYKRRS